MVQASGHAGPWLVVEVSKGMASLQHPDGHRLSVRTTTLSVVRKASRQEGEADSSGTAGDESSGDAPTLFD
ncbi:hypothetical protein BFN03_19410 [Rhodococcus sp. WMMA185]|nr:hypothetical protein BFN03_19410 [Rhodococcus sp. WMMA185]